MEVKILINSLLIILIIYIMLDNIPYRYRFGVEKRIQNNRFMERYSEENRAVPAISLIPSAVAGLYFPSSNKSTFISKPLSFRLWFPLYLAGPYF